MDLKKEKGILNEKNDNANECKKIDLCECACEYFLM